MQDSLDGWMLGGCFSFSPAPDCPLLAALSLVTRSRLVAVPVPGLRVLRVLRAVAGSGVLPLGCVESATSIVESRGGAGMALGAGEA